MRFSDELLSMVDELSIEDAGKLFKAIIAYQIRGETPEDNTIKILFSPFKFSIEQQIQRENEIREKRRQSGAAGGKAKASKSYQMLANASKCQSGKKNTVESRRKYFYNSLVPFVNTYPKKMIRDFYDYWSELNKSGTKMRFELQKTWETNLRLANWANKEKCNGKSTDKAASREKLDDLADRILDGYQS